MDKTKRDLKIEKTLQRVTLSQDKIQHNLEVKKLLQDIIKVSKRLNQRSYEPSVYELFTLQSAYILLKSLIGE